MPGSWTSADRVYQFLAITGIEILLIVVVAVVIAVALRVTAMRLKTLPALERYAGRFDMIHRRARSGMTLLALLLVIAAIAANGVLFYQQIDLLEYMQQLFTRLPPDFWWRLALGAAAVGVIAFVAAGLIRLLSRLLLNLQERTKAYEQIKSNDESIEAFFASLRRILTNSIWLLVAYWAAGLLQMPPLVATLVSIGLRIYLIVALGLLVVKAVAAIVASLDALSQKYANTDALLAYYQTWRRLVPLFRRTLEYIIYVVVATLVTLQISFIAQFAEYGPKVVQIIGTIFLSRVAIEVMSLVVDRTLFKPGDHSELEQQRQLTLAPLVKSSLRYVIFFVAFILILRSVDIDPTPILAGAGIIGLVVGLGAQPLINDIVSGFFIILENIYLVGDYIETGTSRGVVEVIDIRTTRIRDPNGQQHILRNGQLNEVINYSKSYTFAVVEVGVAYASNLDHVYRVIEETGERLKATHIDVLDKTVVQGLASFGASELLIRTVTRVKPGRHQQVARDLRKLLKEAFDREGIEIPFSQHVVTLHSPTTP